MNKIGIASLDDSQLITVGGKHIHQQLLEKGLIKNGEEVLNFFPQKGIRFKVIRVIFAILNRLGLISKNYIYKWTLNHHRESIEKQVNENITKLKGIFAQDPVAAVACSAGKIKKSDVKLVLTLHGYLSLESVNYGNYSEKEKKMVIESALFYERKALEICNKVITVDTRIANYLIDKFSYTKEVTILKNAINPDLFNNTNQVELSSIKSKFNIPENNKVVLVPRRLVKKNGVEVSIRSLKLLLDLDIKKLTFLIMGDGPLKNELVGLKEMLNISDKNLIFLGSIPYSLVPQFYDLADIVLVPSIISDGVEEATSLSMLEAMAAKKIVIVSNIGGMKEVIHDEENGFLAEQNNVESLAETIKKVINYNSMQMDKIKEAGLNDVIQKHHYLKHTEIYLSQLNF